MNTAEAYSLAARLKEPSSWASIAALLALVGVHVAPEAWTAIVAIGTGLAGAAGLLLPERKAG